MTEAPVGTTYNYSVTRHEDGKWYGTLYAAGVAVEQIVAKNEKSLKAHVRALAEQHHRENTPGETHGVSASAFGTFSL